MPSSPAAKGSTSSSPSAAARQSFTSALSRQVWLQMAAMPRRASSVGAVPGSSAFSGWKITGWWLMISCAPRRAASSTASGVMSSTSSALVTSVSGSPASRPLLSHFSWVRKGASSSSFPYSIETVDIVSTLL